MKRRKQNGKNANPNLLWACFYHFAFFPLIIYKFLLILQVIMVEFYKIFLVIKIKCFREKLVLLQKKISWLIDVSNKTIIYIEVEKQNNSTINNLKKTTIYLMCLLRV